MRPDNRFVLTIIMLSIFCLWLALVAFWFVPMVNAPEQVDPMMALIAGLGVGGVTQLFAVLITLSWQFYFRKKTESEEPR